MLQRAVVMILEAIYEQDFYDGSYGFRPGRSPHQALDALRETLKRHSGGWVLEVDIRSFFDTLDHAHLREFLKRRVRDGVLLRSIGKWLKAGVMEDGTIHYPDSGSPQGGVIAPQTILQTGPASGALDKRELPYIVYNSDIFLANLHTFHQRPNHFAFVDPIERFDAGGKLL